jgi:hypothetical protein
MEPGAFVRSHRKTYNGKRWPKRAGAHVSCRDYKPDDSCGHGLHAINISEPDHEPRYLDFHRAATWYWLHPVDGLVCLDGKYKARRWRIIAVGTREHVAEAMERAGWTRDAKRLRALTPFRRGTRCADILEAFLAGNPRKSTYDRVMDEIRYHPHASLRRAASNLQAEALQYLTEGFRFVVFDRYLTRYSLRNRRDVDDPTRYSVHIRTSSSGKWGRCRETEFLPIKRKRA